jgi:DUF971 family protein
MADPMYEPKSIQILGEGLALLWKDGHRTLLEHRYLRGRCGCAQCVDEMTHERLVAVQDVGPDVRVEDFIEVGNYAVEILFSDLHFTGIYPFTLLRKLCNCTECRVLS